MKLNIAIRPIAEIKPYELNAKIHDQKQVEKIAESIKKFGWDQPIVVDQDGVIIKGHGRRLAALHLGLTEVPVWTRDDLTPEQVKAARLADNRVALGDVDADILRKELETFNVDLLENIFDFKEIDFMTADMAEMNLDAIVLDLESAVAEQDAQTMKKIEETDERLVRLDKVLGFKEIQGKDERAVVRFMALMEGETGLEGRDAFVAYAKRVMETA